MEEAKTDTLNGAGGSGDGKFFGNCAGIVGAHSGHIANAEDGDRE
jgi:hypothetical protein